MRKLMGLLGIVLALLLSSCGGGGGYAGDTGPTNELRMSPLLSALSLPLGYFSDAAKITQGVGPYHVTSSTNAAEAEILPDGTLRVWGMSPGTSTVAVQDSSVSQKTISLTVDVKVTPLNASVGSELFLNAGETRTFTISGGVAPYSVVSNNNSIATVVSQVGGAITVLGRSKGSAVLLVTDGTGATLQVLVTVNAVDFGVSPDKGAGQVGTNFVLTVVGGVGPYFAISSAPSVASIAGVEGSVVNVRLNAEGTSVVTVLDSTGQNFPVELTVTDTVPPLRISPTAATGNVGTRLVYTIIGGVSPYTAISSNPAVAAASVSGSLANVSLVGAGSGTITVRDAKGQTVAATVTATIAPVTPTPPAPTLTVSPATWSGQVGTNLVLTVTGAIGSITATSSNPSLATASVSGSTVSVALVAAGVSTITVLDSNGRRATAVITGTVEATQPLEVSPPSGSGRVGTSMVLAVVGGKAPYSVVSSYPDVVTATVSGSQVNASFVTAGTSTLTIVDAAGAAVAVPMTSTSTVPELAVNPPSATGQVGTSMDLTIVGGQGPYSAVVANSAVALVNLTGNTIRVDFVSAGSTTALVRDAIGQQLNVTLTATFNAVELTVSPTSVADYVGKTVVFTVGGGTGPYTAVSSNPQMATTSVNGSTVSVNLIGPSLDPPDDPITITIADATGQIVTATVSSRSDPTVSFGAYPDHQAVSQHSLGSLQYQLINGAGGPYVAIVNSTDATIASAWVEGTVLNIGVGSSGNRCIGTGTRLIQVTVVDNTTGQSTVVGQTIDGSANACP